MTHHATIRPHTSTGRRRVPALIALGAAAGLALAACSGNASEADDTSTVSSSTLSSSSSISSPTTSSTEATADPISAPATTSTTAAPATTPSPELPANVVGTGGPCHILGEVAQAEDGSALFCTNDPTMGPIWLPAGAAEGSDGAEAVGQAQPGGPCAQEGLSVDGPGDTILTCTLVGGGQTPGGLFWQ